MRVWWLLVMTVVLALTAGAAVAQEDPAALLASGGLRDSVAGPLRQLLDPALSPTDRRAAAARLLDESHKDAVRAVAAAIDVDAPEHVWRAAIEAIALHPKKPNDAWWTVLLNRYMLATTEPDIALLADALGRFDNNTLRRRVRETSEDAAEPVEVRARMIRLWGYFRDKDTVERLLKLTETTQAQPVRQAAYDALIHLTGLEELNHDPAAWVAWWDEAKRLGGEAWLTHIMSNLTRRESAMRLRMSEGEQRLLVSQEALYRATQASDRPGVLAYMLRDALPPIRQLGLDLCLQRLLDDQPFEESLRVALRERLLDDSPVLRSRAALLLRDLLDEPAAKIVAERLSNNEEHVVEVVRSYLLLVSRLPQQPVVTPALALLEDTSLRPEAAGVLAAAADARLLATQEVADARKLARRGLPANRLPAPQVVTLLGKVGDEEDFARIAQWIDSDGTSVKQAAALAWADSTRSLKMLADRAADPIIRPIVIAAAERRGNDAPTLTALALNRPPQSESAESWRRAIVAMAGRGPVGGEAVLSVVEQLQASGEPPATLERLLTAAIQASADSSKPPTDVQLQLLLKRAEVRVIAGTPAPALADFGQLAESVGRLRPADVERYRRGRIRALLDSGDVTEALAEAERLLSPSAAGGTASPSDDRVIDQFIDAARRLHEQRKPDAGRDVLVGLRRLLGPSIKPEIAQRITLLEAEMRSTPRP